MANKIVTMNKLRKILRMLDQGNSKRAVSRTLGTSRKTIDKYASVFDHHPLGYKGLLNLSDKELYSLVLPPSTDQPTHQELYGLFPKYEQELQKIGVTKLFLWERYKGLYPEGVQYSQFCDHFGRYLKSQQISMVLEHKAGDKLMVDYAGKKLFLTDPDTGEHIAVEFFVGILPSSGLTYARACYSQKSEDFLGCLSHCLEAIGGVPQAIVTDNLKPAVNKASKYDPELNKSMYDFAEHYQTTVLPTRARKPKDKALVESAVNILYTRVYAPLQYPPDQPRLA
jgi:transposase